MSFDIPEGRFYKGIDGYTIRAGKKGADGNTLYDLMIYDHTDYKGNAKVTTADSAVMALSPNQTEIIFTLYSTPLFSNSSIIIFLTSLQVPTGTVDLTITKQS